MSQGFCDKIITKSFLIVRRAVVGGLSGFMRVRLGMHAMLSVVNSLSIAGLQVGRFELPRGRDEGSLRMAELVHRPLCLRSGSWQSNAVLRVKTRPQAPELLRSAADAAGRERARA